MAVDGDVALDSAAGGTRHLLGRAPLPLDVAVRVVPHTLVSGLMGSGEVVGKGSEERLEDSDPKM